MELNFVRFTLEQWRSQGWGEGGGGLFSKINSPIPLHLSGHTLMIIGECSQTILAKLVDSVSSFSLAPLVQGVQCSQVLVSWD